MKSILVFRSAALGDFVMAVPALKKLRSIYPDREIVFLTTQTTQKNTQKLVVAYAGGASKTPWVKLVMPHLIDDVVVIPSISGLGDIHKVRKILAGRSFESVILMLDPCAPLFGRLKKLLLLLWLLPGVPIYGWRGKGALNGNHKILKESGYLRHHVHGPLQFLSELSPAQSYTNAELEFDLRPDEKSLDWAQKWLVEQGLYAKRWVAIAPGAIQAHKQWPLSSFAALVHRLLDRYSDLSVVVIGTPNDHSLGELLSEISPQRVFNIAGISSISQSAALLAHAALLVGNDGGAMHLGDAMKCKVISIVPGIEYPDSIEPWNNQKLAVRWPVSCAPCYSFTSCPKGHNKCMNELPVDLVWSQCEKVL